MKRPFFSVVIPIYNRKEFLRTCLNSVLEQTFSDFEIFVIDDGSTDETLSLVSEYLNYRINYIRVGHFGVSSARNIGIELSKGRYIAFLDSDDRWNKEKLKIAYEYINEYPEIKIFHTEEVWIKNGKILNQKKKHKKPSGYVYKNCLPLCCIGMSTSVVKRTLFNEIGTFDECLQACEDYDLWLRACHCNEVKLIPKALTVKYGGRKDQLSNQVGLDKFRIYALEKILKSNLLNDCYKKATIQTLIEKCEIYANGARKRGKLKEYNVYALKIDSYRNFLKELI